MLIVKKIRCINRQTRDGVHIMQCFSPYLLSTLQSKNYLMRKEKVIAISHETLKRLITLLEPFVLATRELEADDIPTQHIIIPWYFSLMKLIQSRNTKV